VAGGTPITRDLIVDRLGTVQYPRFLLYVMGPYKSFNLNYVFTETERDEIDVSELPGPLRKLFRNEEAGSILAALSESRTERLVVLHEDDVTSAMLSSARDRWDVSVDGYASETELVETIRLYAGEIMEMERCGELPRLD